MKQRKKILVSIICFVILLGLSLPCYSRIATKSQFDRSVKQELERNFSVPVTIIDTEYSLASKKSFRRASYKCHIDEPIQFDFTVCCRYMTDLNWCLYIEVSDNYKFALDDYMTAKYGVCDITNMTEDEVVEYIFTHIEEYKAIQTSILSEHYGASVPDIKFVLIRDNKTVFNRASFNYCRIYGGKEAIRSLLDETVYKTEEQKKGE